MLKKHQNQVSRQRKGKRNGKRKPLRGWRGGGMGKFRITTTYLSFLLQRHQWRPYTDRVGQTIHKEKFITEVAPINVHDDHVFLPVLLRLQHHEVHLPQCELRSLRLLGEHEEEDGAGVDAVHDVLRELYSTALDGVQVHPALSAGSLLYFALYRFHPLQVPATVTDEYLVCHKVSISRFHAAKLHILSDSPKFFGEKCGVREDIERC